MPDETTGTTPPPPAEPAPLPATGGGPVAREGLPEDSVLAAFAPDAVVDADLASVRTAATGYQTLITSAFGLFSISGIVFAADPISKLQSSPKVAAGVAAGAAFVAGLVAIALITFAAHGWPKIKKRKESGKKIYEVDVQPRDRALRAAVQGLRNALIAAAISVVLLAIAVAFVWFGEKVTVPAGR